MNRALPAITLTIPNLITAGRLLMAPLFIVFSQYHIRYGLVILVMASASDWLDGFLARKFSSESALGALLDPIADKAMSWSALFTINYFIHSSLILLSSAIIITRDGIISLMRLRTCESGHKQLQVSKIAKIKTGCLFMSQFLLIFYLYAQNDLVYRAGSMLLYASSLLTLISFAGYMKKAKELN